MVYRVRDFIGTTPPHVRPSNRPYFLIKIKFALQTFFRHNYKLSISRGAKHYADSTHTR